VGGACWPNSKRIEADGLVDAGAFVSPFTLGCPAVDGALPRGGLPRGALHEVMAAEHRDRPAALGFLSGLLVRLLNHLGPHDRRPILWAIQEEGMFDFGGLYGPGLRRFGLDPDRLITVSARATSDVLWAMEEALKCSALAGVVGVFGRGSQRSGGLDLTALRRLQLAAEQGGLPAFMLRLPVDAPVTAARTRWRIAARPSAPPPWVEQAPLALRNHGIGKPRWQVALEKCRGGAPAAWQLEWEYAAHRFCLAAPVADRSAVPGGAPEVLSGGQVIPLRGRNVAQVA
jgi:protein ImuA